MIFNKIDLLEDYDGIRNLEHEYPNSIFISAERHMNMLGLLNLMQKIYDETSKSIEFLLPYSSMELVSKLYSIADVQKREENDEGIHFQVKVQPDKSDYFHYYFGDFISAHQE
jgi:GTP-binding protein HflX